MKHPFVMLAALALGAGCSPAGAGCSVGQGNGDVYSRGLFAHDCWGTPPATPAGTAVGACYDLQPDFFAAEPYRSTLLIRLQRGSDIAEFSDGLYVSIVDVPTILSAIAAAQADGGAPDAGAADGGMEDGGLADGGAADGGAAGGGYGLGDGGVVEPVSCEADTPDAGPPSLTDPPSCDAIPPPAGKATFRVAVPDNVRVPGSPGGLPPDLQADPPIVSMSLNLEHSCHNQNVVLQSVSGWIAFNALFDGDPNETQAAAKLTDATFNVEFGDLSDVPIGGFPEDVPPGLRSRVCGAFRFYFERGQPGQPFP